MNAESGAELKDVSSPGHPPCARCLSRAARRRIERSAKSRGFKCCALDSNGVRKQQLGAHEHGARSSAHDHPTGTAFWANMPGVTSAVLRRMKNMEFYLRNEEPPIKTIGELVRESYLARGLQFDI